MTRLRYAVLKTLPRKPVIFTELQAGRSKFENVSCEGRSSNNTDRFKVTRTADRKVGKGYNKD